MYREICLVLVVALLLGGCVRKQTPPQAKTAKTQQTPAGPVKTAAPKTTKAPQTSKSVETPKPSTSSTATAPVEAGHPIVAVARQFLHAVGAGDAGRAIALCTSDKVAAQGLAQMNLAFQMDQADVTQAWLGAKRAAVITNFIPTKQGSVAGAWWSLSLVAAEEGRWRISEMSFLPDESTVEKYLAAFRAAEPNAKSIEP